MEIGRRGAMVGGIAALGLVAGTAAVGCANTRSTSKAEVKTAQVGDVKIAYHTRGQGEPLLMINGFLASQSLWDPALLDDLSERSQLILFDNRGVGLSTDTADDRTTIAQMADDAAGLINALGLKKANILAYSMGARIGQQLLIRHPDLVGRAVLCGANPGGIHADPAAEDVENKLNNPDVPNNEKIALCFTDDETGKKAAAETVGRIKAAVADGSLPDDFTVPKETIARQDRARMQWNTNNENFDALKKVTIPVLLTDGRSDIIDPPKNSLTIANQIPYSWLAFFEGGHAFLFQSHQEFSATVNAFLQ